MSAILLPWLDGSTMDWDSWEMHVCRTADAGLIPAVNMDTGYVHLLSDDQRREVLHRTSKLLGGMEFVAGAIVSDRPGASFDEDMYAGRLDEIVSCGGTPVVFPSYGLTRQEDGAIVRSHEALAARCDRFLGFELGTMFAPFGKIYSLEVYEGLMGIPRCVGAKHSSLSREKEWERLRRRDQIRPDFQVLTGNDLAIDMVMWGSDYLLGLSTMAPDLFARRDRWWFEGDARFFELNDALQALGSFTFREPVPAYKHSAAQFLHLRGWIKTSLTHPESPTRPASDEEILRRLADRLGVAQ
jgi:dihydrodipicolinate synthase/N-acetylneuraminate lyase